MMRCTQTEWTVSQLAGWLNEMVESTGSGALVKLGSVNGELLHTVGYDSDEDGWVHVVLT